MSRIAKLPAIVDLLYAAALEPQRWPDALHELGQAVGAIGTVLLPISQQGPPYHPGLAGDARAQRGLST